MDYQFLLRFDGLEATKHHMPMQQLGHSLIGADRILNTGLIFLEHNRLPRRGEKHNLRVAASAPSKGSLDIHGLLTQAPWVLPLVYEFVARGGGDLASRFMSYVLSHFGGRPKEAHDHSAALLQMSRDHLESRQVSEAQWQATLLAAVDRLAPAAQLAVTPVGRSAAQLQVGTPRQPKMLVVDEPMADAIRSKENDEVGDLQEMRLKVDGFIHHSRQLKIAHPDIEGKYLTAEVRDPAFDKTPNAYSEAASNLREIVVQAKPVFRNGELYKIYIMDAAKSDR